MIRRTLGSNFVMSELLSLAPKMNVITKSKQNAARLFRLLSKSAWSVSLAEKIGELSQVVDHLYCNDVQSTEQSVQVGNLRLEPS